MEIGFALAGLFGIYSTLAMDLASSLLSSPQTTELFAGARSGTLWKWVMIAGGVTISFGIIGSIMAGSIVPLLSVGLVAALFGVLYKHALDSGLKHEADTFRIPD